MAANFFSICPALSVAKTERETDFLVPISLAARALDLLPPPELSRLSLPRDPSPSIDRRSWSFPVSRFSHSSLYLYTRSDRATFYDSSWLIRFTEVIDDWPRFPMICILLFLFSCLCFNGVLPWGEKLRVNEFETSIHANARNPGGARLWMWRCRRLLMWGKGPWVVRRERDLIRIYLYVNSHG